MHVYKLSHSSAELTSTVKMSGSLKIVSYPFSIILFFTYLKEILSRELSVKKFKSKKYYEKVK